MQEANLHQLAPLQKDCSGRRVEVTVTKSMRRYAVSADQNPGLRRDDGD
jgi:hypothetical protein